MTSDTYRLGDPDFDASRARFYAACARVFGFEGWKLDPAPVTPPKGKPGREGKASEIQKYGNPSIASYRDESADAMQWLVNKGLLNSIVRPPRTDRERDIAWSEGRTRINTVDRLDRLFEGAQLTTLKSADLDAVSSGFGPRTPADRKIDCMKAIQDMRNEIPPMCMAILEDIILRNKFIWRGVPKKRERAILEEIRFSIDFATWALDRFNAKAELTEQELRERWPAADEYFRQRILRPATHLARIAKRPG